MIAIAVRQRQYLLGVHRHVDPVPQSESPLRRNESAAAKKIEPGDAILDVRTAKQHEPYSGRTHADLQKPGRREAAPCFIAGAVVLDAERFVGKSFGAAHMSRYLRRRVAEYPDAGRGEEKRNRRMAPAVVLALEVIHPQMTRGVIKNGAFETQAAAENGLRVPQRELHHEIFPACFDGEMPHHFRGRKFRQRRCSRDASGALRQPESGRSDGCFPYAGKWILPNEIHLCSPVPLRQCHF